MADKKLRIPGPEEREDPTQLDNAIFYGLMVCLLVGGLLALYTKRQARASEPMVTKAAPPPTSNLEVRQRALVEAHADAPTDHEWDGEDAIAVLRYGPRGLAEAACRDAFAREDGLRRAVRVELLAAANRGAKHTPWVCLMRAFLQDQTPAEGQLHDKLAAYWEDMAAFRAPPGVSATIVESFASEGTPDNERYRDWLHLCAFKPSAPGEQCRAGLRKTVDSPTLLDLFDAMLHRFDDLERREAAVVESTEGLAALAKNGELEGWARPDDISELDVRLGAIFWMCRFTHAPNERLARVAAEGLSDVGNMAVRAGDDNLVPRWRQACQLAFQDGGSEKEPRAPVLAVWSGNEGEAPVYTLAEARERGDCVAPDDAPLWMCGPAAWKGQTQGKLQRELMDFFTKTRWIEWRD
jgi:hypothetical protein